MNNYIRTAFTAILFIFSTSLALAQLPSTSSAEVTSEQSVTIPENLTPESIRGLVSSMSDEQVRSLLLDRLDAVAKKQTETNAPDDVGIADLLNQWVVGAASQFTIAISSIHKIPDSFRTSFGNFHDKHGTDGIIKAIAIAIGAILAGLVAEKIVNRIVRSKRQGATVLNEQFTLGQTLKSLGTRLFWDLIALIVFFVVTRYVVVFFMPPDMTQVVSNFMVSMVVLPRWAWVFSRFLNAPNQPELRMLNTTNDEAKFFHWNLIGITAFIGFSGFLLDFQFSHGVTPGVSRLGFWLNNFLFVWFIAITYFGRHSLISILIGSKPEEVTPAEEKVARFFPLFLIGFILLTWIVTLVLASMKRFDLLDGRQYIILILVSFAPALDTMIRGLVRHLVPPMQGEGIIANRAYHSTKRSYIRIGRVILFAIIIVLIARMMEIDFDNISGAGVGAAIGARFFEIMMIIAIGYLIWEVITLLINRKLAAEMTAAGFDLEDDEPGGGEGGGAGGSRLSTVLPMIRFTLQIAIVTMTALIALSNMGVDITPLLAGAGVLGIAIGFGAQSLVKDIVSGIFFLVEDAFRVGEYLQINDIVGTVEKISLRSLQLRHHNGPIHTIPFGEIPKVTNNSRDWVIMKLKWTLPFGTDPNKVKKLFKEIGKEMMEADYAENIIQTFKSQGVYDVDDVGVIFRGKFMAKPGTQWLMRKDVFARVQKKLELHGIQFARREVLVNVPGLDDAENVSDSAKKTIATAAAQSAQDATTTPKGPMPDTP